MHSVNVSYYHLISFFGLPDCVEKSSGAVFACSGNILIIGLKKKFLNKSAPIKKNNLEITRDTACFDFIFYKNNKK